MTPLLKTYEAAERVGASKSTLERLRVQGGGPRYVKFGACVRYRAEDLDAWAASKLISHTSQG